MQDANWEKDLYFGVLCSPCSIGFFSDTDNAIFCTYCGHGHTTLQEGSTSAADCVRGKQVKILTVNSEIPLDVTVLLISSTSTTVLL